MREFKFRVWNTETNKMIINVKEMGVFALQSIYSIDEFLVIPTNEKYPLMQYTGLKDKNGVQIYKSDLLKDDKDRIFKVIEDERIGATGYIMECVKNKSEKDYIKIGNIYGFYCWIIPFYCLEVIGNIYENTELLKED